MSSRLLPLLLLLALLAAPVALAQEAGNETNDTTEAGNETGSEGAGGTTPPGPVEITLVGHQEGGSFFFTVQGESASNPTLYVTPGAEVTIRLVIDNGFHNIHVENGPSSGIVGPGQETSVTFTAPESGSLQYWCDPHRGSGMVGTIVFGAPGQGGGARPVEGGEDVRGPAVDLGDLGYPQCAGYRIPAVATRGIAGGPTVADYVERCMTAGGGEAPQAADPYKAADLVLPGSFLLIGLGVAAIVWVHKFYNP